jgi:hypothetical protein
MMMLNSQKMRALYLGGGAWHFSAQMVGIGYLRISCSDTQTPANLGAGGIPVGQPGRLRQ